MTRISVLLCSLVVAFGCAKSSGTYDFTSPSVCSIESGDAVTLLLTDITKAINYTRLDRNRHYAKKEKKAYECISSAFKDLSLDICVIPPDEFRQTAFPDLSPDKTSTGNWENLVKDNAFNERIASLNLRYLILIEEEKGSIDGEKLEIDGSGELIIGVVEDEYYTKFFAKIIDLTTHDIEATVRAGSRSTDATGICLVYFFPIPIYAPAMPTYSKACEQLGKNVAEVFSEIQKGVPEDSLEGKATKGG
jgi:hypothetical protein